MSSLANELISSLAHDSRQGCPTIRVSITFLLIALHTKFVLINHLCEGFMWSLCMNDTFVQKSSDSFGLSGGGGTPNIESAEEKGEAAAVSGKQKCNVRAWRGCQ